MAKDPAVIIVGAGMAGLAAAHELGRAGLSVLILEARDRIGGRLFTLHPPGHADPVELGAEFIHGKPREIWDPLEKAKAGITEVDGDNWCVSDGRLSPCDFFEDVDSILNRMDDSVPDESFLSFLERCFADPKTQRQRQAIRRSIGYVSGFNAADPRLVGVHWLVQGSRAEEKIQGDRVFRPQNGYGALLEIFQQQNSEYGIKFLTGVVVDQLNWRTAHVTIQAHSSQESLTFEASHVLVTLPLSVLKAGAVKFTPQLPQTKFHAMNKLEMGKVIRVVLRFRQRFWQEIKPAGTRNNLSKLAFLLSEDEWFPTWWTSMPEKTPIMTGWAPFRSAELLSGQTETFVIERSLETLSSLLGPSPRELESILERVYFHDWQTDPFSMGAYSYGKVGSDGSQQVLAAPLENTLFFAGEATDTCGHNGTIHGAIASGYRAAQEIIRATA